jgi:hypothetical protein
MADSQPNHFTVAKQPNFALGLGSQHLAQQPQLNPLAQADPQTVQSHLAGMDPEQRRMWLMQQQMARQQGDPLGQQPQMNNVSVFLTLFKTFLSFFPTARGDRHSLTNPPSISGNSDSHTVTVSYPDVLLCDVPSLLPCPLFLNAVSSTFC